MSSLQAFFFYRQKNLHKFNLWNLLNNLLIQIPFSSHHIHRFNFPINLLNTSKFRAIDTDFKRSRMDRLVIKNIETQFPSWDILYISLDDSTRWFNENDGQIQGEEAYHLVGWFRQNPCRRSSIHRDVNLSCLLCSPIGLKCPANCRIIGLRAGEFATRRDRVEPVQPIIRRLPLIIYNLSRFNVSPVFRSIFDSLDFVLWFK